MEKGIENNLIDDADNRAFLYNESNHVRKILFFADLHASQKNIEKANTALKFIFDVVTNRRPDLILIAGDLWDGTIEVNRNSPLYIVVDWIQKLADICSIVILPGTPSHDRPGSLDIFERIVTNHPIHILKNPIVAVINDCLIMPIPGLTKSGMEAWLGDKNIMLPSDQCDQEAAGLLRSLLLAYRSQFAKLSSVNPNLIPILLGHFSVRGAETPTGQIMTGGDIVISSADITEAGAVINCLGHIHKAQTIGSNIIYSGSPFPCNWGEKEQKSIVWAEVNSKEILKLEQIPTPFPPMIDVEFEYDLNLPGDHFKEPPGQNLEDCVCADVRCRLILSPEHKDSFSDDWFEKYIWAHLWKMPNSIKFEKIVKAQSRERCEIITKVATNTERLNAWGEVTQTNITAGAIVKLEDLEESLELNCQIKAAKGTIRLKSLLLRGAKGIKWADEIYIDFEHFHNDMILFDADNGAGKTTIFDNLHPYPFLPYYQGINWNAKIADAFSLEDSRRDMVVEIDGLNYRFSIKIDALRGKAEYYAFRQKGENLPPLGYEWEPLNDGKKPSYKEIVLELFGSPELYLQTVYQVQESKGLIGQTNASIKDLFYEFLGFEQYQIIADQMKKAAEDISATIKVKENEIAGAAERIKTKKGLSTEIETCNQKIIECKQELDRYAKDKTQFEDQIKTLEQSATLQESYGWLFTDLTKQYDLLTSEIYEQKEKYNNWSKKQSSKIDDLNIRIETDAALISQKDTILPMLERAEQYAKVNTECLNKREILKAKRGALEQKHSIYDAKINACKQKISSTKKEIETGSKLTEPLENVPCQALLPEDSAKICQTCPLIVVAIETKGLLPELDQELAGHIAELEAMPRWENESMVLQNDIAAIAEDLAQQEIRLKTIPAEATRIDWRTKNAELQSALTREEELQNRLREMQEILVDQRRQYDEIMAAMQARLDGLSAQKEETEAKLDDKIAKELNAIKRHRILAEEQIAEHNALILDAQKRIAAADARLKDLQELEITMQENQKQLADLRIDLAEYNVLQAAFSRNGIPTLLMENILPRIAELTNSLLCQFSAGMQVRFDTTRDRANGQGQIETFEIMVIDESGERPIELLSGGQKVPFIVAMQTALSIYRAQQSGFHPKFAIVDECDGPLREFRASALFNMLQKRMELAGLEMLLIVTHREALAEQCNQKIILDTGAGKIVEVY